MQALPNLLRTHPTTTALVAAGGAMAGSWVLFTTLMQHSAPFHEFVGNLSPDLAAKFGCTCPFCTRTPVCRADPAELTLARLDTGLDDLLRGLDLRQPVTPSFR